MGGKIRQHPARFRLANHGAYRDPQDEVRTVLSVPVFPLPMPAASGPKVALEVEIYQRSQTFVGPEDNVPAPPAVTARRSAQRNVLFPAKGDTAVAPVSGLDVYF